MRNLKLFAHILLIDAGKLFSNPRLHWKKKKSIVSIQFSTTYLFVIDISCFTDSNSKSIRSITNYYLFVIYTSCFTDPNSKSFWSRTTDIQWRHKSKKSEILGRCGRQDMLQPYLKIWDWDLIFGRAGKAISSLDVRSPWPQWRLPW